MSTTHDLNGVAIKAEEVSDASAVNEDNSRTRNCAKCPSFHLIKKGATPPNWEIITLTFICMFGSAYSITFLFPFLPEMILFFGYKEEEKGYYAGLVASAMFFGRMFGSYFWGWLSDKKGRKIVMMLSLILMALSHIGFGFCINVKMAIIFRIMNGIVNGSISTCKVVLYEISDTSNQAAGMSAIAMAWGTGVVVGPLISGFLASPAVKYPSVFSDTGYFAQFPFLLPSLVAMVFCIGPAIIIWLKLPETSVHTSHVNSDIVIQKEHQRDAATEELLVSGPFTPSKLLNQNSIASLSRSTDDIHYIDNYVHEEAADVYGLGCMKEARSYATLTSSKHSLSGILKEELWTADVDTRQNVANGHVENNTVLVEPNNDKKNSRLCRCLKYWKNTAIYEMLSNSEVCLAIGTYTITSFSVVGLEEIFCVWASTKVEMSGLGFTSGQIGSAIGFSSLPLITLQIFTFPFMESRLGGKKTFFIFCTYLIVFSVSVVTLRALHDRPGFLWPLIMIMMGLEKMAVISCFSATSIFINNSVPPRLAGSANGLAMTLTALARTLAPTVGGSIFSWSITHGEKIGFPLDVNLVFIFFGIVYLIANIIGAFIPRKLEKQTKKNSNDR